MNNQPHPTTPEHRATVLARLAELWDEAPHLRLGQLVSNLARPERPEESTIREFGLLWKQQIYNIYDLDLVSESLHKKDR